MSRKQERVEEVIREEVSEILRERVSDPRIGFVSITSVDISPDLKNTRIFVSIMGTEKEKNESMQGLASATPFIRGELSHLLGMRLVPEIIFVRDDSLERGSRVLSIINRLNNDKNTRRNKKSLKKR